MASRQPKSKADRLWSGGADNAADEAGKAPKMTACSTVKPWLTTRLLDAIHSRLENDRVIAIIGPGGAGKLLKACQFVQRFSTGYGATLVFHAYNNDDVYGYFKRVKEQIQNTAQILNAKLCARRSKARMRISSWSIINNIDLLLGCEKNRPWVQT